MAWWQRKLLKHLLSRTGLLDEEALDEKIQGIGLGFTSTVELKDVALNVKQLNKLAQLPPSLRVETARVLSLLVTLPFNLYQADPVVEVDGVLVTVRLEGQVRDKNDDAGRHRTSAAGRSPEHRKVHRRLRSPPPSRAAWPSELDDDMHIPTARELATSFLREEPEDERRKLEASVAADTKSLDESMTSEAGYGGDVGTGAAIGLPAWLAGYLQRSVDQAQVRIRNTEVKIEADLPDEALDAIPVVLRLRIGSVALERLELGFESNGHDGKRHISVQNVSLDLLSDANVFSTRSELQSQASPATSRRRSRSPSGLPTEAVEPPRSSGSASETMPRSQSLGAIGSMSALKSPQDDSRTVASDHATEFGEDGTMQSSQQGSSDLDIQPGDDNVSWGSRRSKNSAPTEDLWSSMASEDDLPDSLLLERATTPRPPASRRDSTAATRTRRAVSPYARSFQSPGSWPRLDHSPDRRQVKQSPGSWPTLDQSQQNVFQPLTPGPAMEGEDPMDNKRAALESSDPSDHSGLFTDMHSSTPQEPASSELEAMAQSKFYSHEEAESLYMSAMTQSPRLNVPGGWGSEDMSSEPSVSPTASRTQQIDGNSESRPSAREPPSPVEEDSGRYSGNATPRANSPVIDSPPLEDVRMASKQLLNVDQISLWVPLHAGVNASHETKLHTQDRTEVPVRIGPRGMPGTFSMSSELGASRLRSPSSAHQDTSDATTPPKHSDSKPDHRPSIDISVGSIRAQIDLPACRLLYRSSLLANAAYKSSSSSAANEAFTPNKPSHSRNPISFSAAIGSVQLSLLEHIPATTVSSHDVGLFTITLDNASMSYLSENFQLRIGRMKAWLSGSELISFDRESTLGSSVLLTEATPDIAIALDTKVTVKQRPVASVNVETLPVKLKLDLGALDDTLASFGGLSGILELSSSLLSDAGTVSSPISAGKPSKGVRFQDEPERVSMGLELKLNARFNGANFILRGDSCALRLDTTTFKVIYREHGISATVEQVILSGPHVPDQENSPISIRLATLRLEHFQKPNERDLERLLSLVTPQKDKYDDDDDIITSVMMSQRQKGTLARMTVGDAKIKLISFDCLQTLHSLGDELSKLSAVAKYLPEDDRPGLLSLVRVKAFEGQFQVNDSFGALQVRMQEFHCAHVGLPALVALSMSDVHVTRPAADDELVHPLLPLSGTDNLPMIMARMLGGEAEPTVKVKLFNICFEYSIPIVLALAGRPDTVAEEMVTEIAQSVADFTLAQANESSSPPSGTGQANAKKTKVDLLVHESGLGLTPENIPSKCLFVLTDAIFGTLVPPDAKASATLELRRAAIFVAKDRTSDVHDGSNNGRGSPSNTTTSARMTNALSKQHYASVGSMMAARVTAQVEDTGNGNSKSIQVDVSNELLLLETCADSTQTLIAIMGALAPPAPPSKQPKYLTEPMTIEDMMASFTGDAFAEPEASPETLFDAEEQSPDDAEMYLDASMLGDQGDDLLAESEMTSSLYGPVSGLLGGLDQPGDDEPDADDFAETAESLLEDDPFEMTFSPVDVGLSDAALMRDLTKQCKPAVAAQPVELELYEIEDLGLDALGADQQALGSHDRFNKPSIPARRPHPTSRKHPIPLRLRLRDAHVIWNIYDGYDWQCTRDGITEAVEQVEARAEERKARRRRSHNDTEEDDTVIGDFLFNSIYVGVPADIDAQELRRQINRGIDDMASETESVPLSGMSRPTAYSASGRPLRQQPRRRLKLERSKTHKVAFELKGISADVLLFPSEDPDAVSSVDVRVRHVDVFDNVPTSTWRKFLTALDEGPGTREMSKPMAHIEVQNVKTLQDFAASELILRVSVLPLRLHVDQDALDFIVRFFEFKDQSVPEPSAKPEQPFIQRLEVETVDLRLDYKPKRIDYGGLRSGHTTELMNVIALDAANIRLKHAIIYGIKGFEPLHKTLNDIWMPDIQRNQLPTVLAGLAPVRGLVNIGSGVRDVVAIPVREYRKDGRIVRSIQKGALHFGKTTTSELARLGAKIAIGTQNMLQGAEGLLSPASASPSGRPAVGRRHSSEQGRHDTNPEEDKHEQRVISAYANQPIGVLSGLRSARRYLERDLLTARDAFIAVQGDVLDSGSPGAAAAAVARHAPTVILRPVIGASRAVGTTLLGVGNQIDRRNVRRVEDKYKRR